jgi:hypothetical protein
MISLLILPILFLSIAMNLVTAMLMAVSTMLTLAMGVLVAALIAYAAAFLGFLILIFS